MSFATITTSVKVLGSNNNVTKVVISGLCEGNITFYMSPEKKQAIKPDMYCIVSGKLRIINDTLSIVANDFIPIPEHQDYCVINVCGNITEVQQKNVKGKELASSSIRVSYGKDDTDWFKLSVWDKKASFLTKYFNQKSKPIAVSGRLSVDNWKRKDGSDATSYGVVATDIYFLPLEPKAVQEEIPF